MTKWCFLILMLCIALSADADIFRLTREPVMSEGVLQLYPEQAKDIYICSVSGIAEIHYATAFVTDNMQVRLMYRVNRGKWQSIDSYWHIDIAIPVKAKDVISVKWMYMNSLYASNLYFIFAKLQ